MLAKLFEAAISGWITKTVLKDEHIDLLLERVVSNGMLSPEQAADVRRDVMANLEPHRAMANLSRQIVEDVFLASVQSYFRAKS